jgi:hypothetical protein
LGDFLDIAKPLPHAEAHSRIFCAAAFPLALEPTPISIFSAGTSRMHLSGRLPAPDRFLDVILSNSKGIPNRADLDCSRSQSPNSTRRHTPRNLRSLAASNEISGPIPAGSPVVIPS